PARAGRLHEVEINLELACKRPDGRNDLERARGRWLGRPRLRGRMGLLPGLKFADHRAGVSLGAFGKLDQRGSHLDQVAFGAEQTRDAAALRRGYLDYGLVGLDRKQRLVDHDVIAFVDVPTNDLRLFEAFAEVGELELAHES